MKDMNATIGSRRRHACGPITPAGNTEPGHLHHGNRTPSRSGARWTALALAAGIGCTAFLGAAGTAQAASNCTPNRSGVVYPPSECSVSVSSSSVLRGSDLGVTGRGFRAGTRVSVFLYGNGLFLGGISVRPSGIAAGNVRLPARIAAGQYTLKIIGINAGNARLGTLRVLITTIMVRTSGRGTIARTGGHGLPSTGGDGTVVVNGSGTGGLAHTGGGAALGLGGLGALLLAAGGVTMVAVRRRRQHG